MGGCQIQFRVIEGRASHRTTRALAGLRHANRSYPSFFSGLFLSK